MKLSAVIGTLPYGYRRRSVWMVLGVIAGALLDFAGVAALLSVLLLLLGDEAYRPYVWGAAGLGVLFMVVKNVFAVRLERRRSRYLLSLYCYFSARMLDVYYHRGLLFIRRSGAATLTYEVNYVCYSFVLQLLAPLLRMMGEALLLFLLLTALFVYSPGTVGLLLLCLLPVLWAYMHWVHLRLDRYGKKENAAKRRQWQRVQELFRGYPEVEINQAYQRLRRRFETGLTEISRCREGMETLHRVPSALIETGMAAALLLVLTVAGGEALELTLGVFGVAAFRILPGVRSLLGCWMQVRNAGFTLDILAPVLAEHENRVMERKTGEELTFLHEICVNHLSFAYAEGAEKVVHDLSFAVRRGECVGIQGASGVGKSTLFNLLLGFFPPCSGEIRIDGTLLTPAHRVAWQRMTGYVPQEVFIMDGTVAENVALGEDASQADRESILSVLRQVRLWEWVNSLPDGLESLLGEDGCCMSGGQKQRIGIARALYKGAGILFLDEATSALDGQTEKEVLEVIRHLSDSRHQLTVLMIAHRASSLQFCDRIIRMDSEKI